MRMVTAVGISPDNHWVVTGSSDHKARLWLFQINHLTNLTRFSVGRNFSAYEWELYFPGKKYRKTFAELPGSDEGDSRAATATHAE